MFQIVIVYSHLRTDLWTTFQLHQIICTIEDPEIVISGRLGVTIRGATKFCSCPCMRQPTVLLHQEFNISPSSASNLLPSCYVAMYVLISMNISRAVAGRVPPEPVFIPLGHRTGGCCSNNNGQSSESLTRRLIYCSNDDGNVRITVERRL